MASERIYLLSTRKAVRGGALAFLFDMADMPPEVWGWVVFEAYIVRGEVVGHQPVGAGSGFHSRHDAFIAGQIAMDRIECAAAAIEADQYLNATKFERGDARAVRIENQYGGHLR